MKIQSDCSYAFVSTLLFCISFFSLNNTNAQSADKGIITSFTPKAVPVKSSEGFTHPGIVLAADDLNRIQKMVRQGYEPWATAFDHFRMAPKAAKDYTIRNLDKNGQPKFEVMGDGNGQYEARQDADAAFAQTIMWYITGDKDYAEKALQIIRSWYSSLSQKTGDMLTAGMVMQKFCFAAEVLRYTPQSGWGDVDTEGFTKFTAIMLPSTDRPTAFMNQGGIATMGYLSIAIFTNDKNLYAMAITRATVGTESAAPNRDYSLKNQIHEVNNPATGKPQMVLVEMGRDQGHAQGDIGALGSLAQTVFIQQTKVNSNGEIVADGTGTSLFKFLDNRLLTAAGIAAKYNLGYDIVYPPTPVGTDAKPETYFDVSPDGRGSLAGVYELIYNHYRYTEPVPVTDSSLKYVQQVMAFREIEGGSQDFFGNGTLFFTHEKAVQNSKAPKGAPGSLVLSNYSSNTKTLGRIQAVTFTGTMGDRTGNIGTEDYTDIEGARPIMNGVKTNFYAWYKDIDFGTEPKDKILVNAGSYSSKGCKIDVILLDKVDGINYENVTEANLAAGAKIATVQTSGTGWWTNFIVYKAALNQKLSGKHSFALRFYDSDNVYRFQANVDWFKFVHTYDGEPDLQPKQQFNPVKADKISIVYKGKATLTKQNAGITALPDGTTVVFPFIEFRNGPKRVAFYVKSNGAAILSMVNINKKDKATDAPFVTVNIADTKGTWTAVYADIDKKITGGQMVYMTLTGSGTKLDFKQLLFDPITKK